MHKSILLVLCLFALLSCEKDIDIPLNSKGGRLYLECFPSNGTDTTYIELKAATPVKEKDASKALDNVNVELFVVGDSHDAELLSKKRGIYTFYVLVPLSVGDEITVKARAEGYPPITAVTYIPEKPDLEFSREIYNHGSIRHSFKVKRDVNDGEVHYYGVCIDGIVSYETTFTDPAKEVEIKEKWLSYDCGAETSLKSLDGSKKILGTVVGGRNMVIFEDDGGASREINVTLSIGFNPDRYNAQTPDYKIFRRTRYNIKTFSLSKTEYEHLNPKRNDNLVGTGLIPPFSSYGNVSGGYGMLSGMGESDTGWLPNLDPL